MIARRGLPKRCWVMPAWLRVTIFVLVGFFGSLGLNGVVTSPESRSLGGALAGPLILGWTLADEILEAQCYYVACPEAWAFGFALQALVWGGAVTLLVEVFRRFRRRRSRT